MGLQDSCLRLRRQASTATEHFWLPAVDLPEADDSSSASSSLRPRSLRPSPPEGHRGPKRPFLQKLYKFFRRPPSCIWVRNNASEDIIVVVSKFGPFRTLAGAELTGSPAGGGLKFDIDSFAVGATRKTLQPEDVSSETTATARFPLWSRFAETAVVSIYRASDGMVYIENDQVPAGGLAIYSGSPNMKLYNFYGEHVDSGPPKFNISPVRSHVVQPKRGRRHHIRIASEEMEKRVHSEDMSVVTSTERDTGDMSLAGAEIAYRRARRSSTI